MACKKIGKNTYRIDWYEQYYDKEGNKKRKRRYATLKNTTYKNAQIELQRKRLEVNDMLNTTYHNNITIAEAFDIFLKYKKDKRSIKSIKYKINNLKKFFPPNKKIRDLTTKEIIAFKNFRKKNNPSIKPATLNRDLETLKSMLNLLVRLQYISQNPIVSFEMEKLDNERSRFLTNEEVQRLLKECHSYHVKLAVKIALNTGMRLGEILKLKWENVNFNTKFIFVIPENSKGKARHIPLNSFLKTTLLEEQKHSSSDYVINYKGQNVKSIHKSFKKAVKRAEIKDFTFHDLRHTAASLMAQNGVDQLTLSKILGHSSLAMTRRYSHLSDKNMINAVEKLCC